MSCLQFSDLFNEGVIPDYLQAPVSAFKLNLRKNGQFIQRENYSSIKLKPDPQSLSSYFIINLDLEDQMFRNDNLEFIIYNYYVSRAYCYLRLHFSDKFLIVSSLSLIIPLNSYIWIN